LKVLFDTHAFLWAISDDERLSSSAGRIFTDPTNQVLLSAASAWEILVKAETGRLPFPRPAGPYLRNQLRKTATAVLPVQLSHVLRLENLPHHHRDPFDRMILAQAIEEEIPVVSADSKFALYPVELLW
jgi:PIN domain nuclease of toxin-antitoxin system